MCIGSLLALMLQIKLALIGAATEKYDSVDHHRRLPEHCLDVLAGGDSLRMGFTASFGDRRGNPLHHQCSYGSTPPSMQKLQGRGSC